MRRLITILISILLFQSFTGFSQRAGFDKDEIYVGDQIAFFLEIPSDLGEKISFPEFKDTLVNGIEIIEEKPLITKKEERILRKEYIITSFEDSLFLLHPFDIKVDKKIYKTNPVKLKVSYYAPDSALSSKIDTTGQFPLADLEPTIQAPLTFNELLQRFWIYFCIIILLTVAFFIYKYYKKKKSEKGTAKLLEVVQVYAHEKALRMLDDLKEKRLHEKEDLKPFYSELSLIVRYYLEDRFLIDAVESVTGEILEEFSETGFNDEKILNELKELLTISDLVKFAKNRPDTEINLKMLENAYSFILNTKEKIVDEPLNK